MTPDQLLTPSTEEMLLCHVVLRGGSWSHDLRYIRSASRHSTVPRDEYHVAGFRLVSPLPERGK